MLAHTRSPANENSTAEVEVARRASLARRIPVCGSTSPKTVGGTWQATTSEWESPSARVGNAGIDFPVAPQLHVHLTAPSCDQARAHEFERRGSTRQIKLRMYVREIRSRSASKDVQIQHPTIKWIHTA